MPDVSLPVVQTFSQDCTRLLSQQLQRPMAALRSAVAARPMPITAAKPAAKANERPIPNPIISFPMSLAAKSPPRKTIDRSHSSRLTAPMTDILFYHLERQPLDRVLPQLLERTLERGWRAVIET